MHFHTCSYLSETRFAHAKPKGDKGFVLHVVQCPGLETPRGTNGPDAANRLGSARMEQLG
jgi:hypothetical protein